MYLVDVTGKVSAETRIMRIDAITLFPAELAFDRNQCDQRKPATFPFPKTLAYRSPHRLGDPASCQGFAVLLTLIEILVGAEASYYIRQLAATPGVIEVPIETGVPQYTHLLKGYCDMLSLAGVMRAAVDIILAATNEENPNLVAVERSLSQLRGATRL